MLCSIYVNTKSRIFSKVYQWNLQWRDNVRLVVNISKLVVADTWILYRDKDVGVSKIVFDAYKTYLTMKRLESLNEESQILLLGLKESNNSENEKQTENVRISIVYNTFIAKVLYFYILVVHEDVKLIQQLCVVDNEPQEL